MKETRFILLVSFIAILFSITDVIIIIENKDSKAAIISHIDSLHTIQMDSINVINSKINIYNDNVETGMLDFLDAETLALMRKEE